MLRSDEEHLDAPYLLDLEVASYLAGMRRLARLIESMATRRSPS